MPKTAITSPATEAVFENISTGLGHQQIATVRRYWRVALRWRWVIGGIVLGGIVAGLIVTLLTTKLYTATATIEISRQRDNVVNVKGVEPEVSSIDAEFYQTQYSLLQARSLAARVASDLKLAEDNHFFDTLGVKPDKVGMFQEVNAGRLTANQRATREEAAIEALLDRISISPVRGSSLVNVSFTSSDPLLSQKIANGWTRAFISSNLDRRFEASAYARRFLEDRLGQLRTKLEESERQTVQYAANQRIVSIPSTALGGGTDRTLVGDDLSRLNGELATATADRIRAQSRLSSSGSVSTEALTNAAITSLRQKRAEVAGDYANLLVRFQPDYPMAKALSSQIAALDRSITREENRVRSGLVADFRNSEGRENQLRSKVNVLTGSALDLRRRSIQYNIYQREADTNRQLYDALLQRYKEIGIAGGVGTNNILIVDDASLPEKPSRPNLLLNLAVALVLSMLVAGATVFVLEQIDEAIADPAEVEQTLKLPQLGTTPALGEADPREQMADRKSALTEAYLSVQTNLRFSTTEGMPKSFAVTSTKPGEGKSTTAFALAQTLSRIGRSVILIDGDMRSPSVHQLLEVDNDHGVSNFLAGENELTSLVHKDAGLGFDSMAAGPQPPNAAELLNSARMNALVKQLLETYDHVIVDSPPVLGLADAPLIGSHVDGIVYVVEANGARSSIIRAAINRLLAVNVTVFGIVLTKFEAKRAHYGYGYEYGYGYGKSA